MWSFHIDGLVQERRNSTANALELRLSYTNPTISVTKSNTMGSWYRWLSVRPHCQRTGVTAVLRWAIEICIDAWRDRGRASMTTSRGLTMILTPAVGYHDDVMKWKHFPRYWPFVRGIRRSPGNSPHKGQWRGALKFYLICAWINVWVNNRVAGDLRHHRGHYDVIVM